MKVAAAQFDVSPVWRLNAGKCLALMHEAARQEATMLVLPEALLARTDDGPDLSVKSAQTPSGDFIRLLLQERCNNNCTDHTYSLVRWQSDKLTGGSSGW